MYVIDNTMTFHISGGRRMVGRFGGQVTVSRGKTGVKGRLDVKFRPGRKGPGKPLGLQLFEG